MPLVLENLKAKVELSTSRSIHNDAINNRVKEITNFLNYGGALEIGGAPVMSPALRIVEMMTSDVIEYRPSDDNSVGTPQALYFPDRPYEVLEVKGIETDSQYRARQVSLEEYRHTLKNYEQRVISVEAAFNDDRAPIIAFAPERDPDSGASKLAFYAFSPVDIDFRIHYWSSLGDAFTEHLNVVADKHGHIYESGVTALIAESVRDDETKNEHWQSFVGRVESLNKSRGQQNFGGMAHRSVHIPRFGSRWRG